MNKIKNLRHYQLMRALQRQPAITQRELADALDIALGSVNQALQGLSADGLLERGEDRYRVTALGRRAMDAHKVDNAIIMVAGFGSRFVPLTYETPKPLIEVKGERMVERQIRMLHQAGINDITLVVGYLKEKFEYLIDKYGVKLVITPDYHQKNTLSTLYHVRHLLGNTYVCVGDVYLGESLFSPYEFDSWYCGVYGEGKVEGWCMFADTRGRITRVDVGGFDAWFMRGPAYLSREFSQTLVPMLERYYNAPGTSDWYWEDVYIRHIKQLPMYVKRCDAKKILEVMRFEDLREIDPAYAQDSHNAELHAIARAFNVEEAHIHDIRPVKDGLTNRSFYFSVEGLQYIFRRPGEGTDVLINRQQEYEAYQAIRDLRISDEVVLFDPNSGYKITKFFENCRSVDPFKDEEVARSLEVIRKVHGCGARVDHNFDLAERIDYYLTLIPEGSHVLYEDHAQWEPRARELLAMLETLDLPETLVHIDFISGNLLRLADGQVRLIDWEYSGMGDPLMDLAVFAIYDYFEQDRIDALLQMYLRREPTVQERLRVYLYVALFGFLWYLWTCFKAALGVEFGDYGMRMYRYLKDYYPKCLELYHELEGKNA